MASGIAASLDDLPASIAALLTTARRAVMTTVQGDGTPHAVPVVFARVGDEVVSPIDHKPKEGVLLKRVKNIERDGRATLLVDRWDEDWTQLMWLMIRGAATVENEPSPRLTRAINDRYEQYGQDEKHDAIIRIRPNRVSWWAWLDPSQID